MSLTSPRLARWLASVNVVMFSAAIFVAVAIKVIPVISTDYGIGDHWPVGHRDLAVVDRTGDRAWHTAILAAVATWKLGGADLRFVVSTGTGACRQTRDHIEICQRPLADIAKEGLAGEEGLFQPKVASGHQYRSAIVLVCSDCGADQTRLTVIATHEIGHSLGLAHNPDPRSVMYPSGGTSKPDGQDYQILRSLEAPAAAKT